MSRRNKKARTRSEVEVASPMRSVCLTCACMESLIHGFTDPTIDRFCKLGCEGREETKKQGRKEPTKLESKQASKQNSREVRKQGVSVLYQHRLHGVVGPLTLFVSCRLHVGREEMSRVTCGRSYSSPLPLKPKSHSCVCELNRLQLRTHTTK